MVSHHRCARALFFEESSLIFHSGTDSNRNDFLPLNVFGSGLTYHCESFDRIVDFSLHNLVQGVKSLNQSGEFMRT